ncbi:carboxymuconolactone decarboxylase family protein [Actinomadura nitritigenes]|uniref:carboxymuconolactone decarboxylase family protein n=1 Tax=Actinomadura nitritigenes TaxID=134602 RepID=UPI003D8A8AE8
MTRKHPFRPADLDGDRLALYRSITEGPRAQGPRLLDLVSDDGVLLGLFNEFLLRPALGDALQRVGAAVRYAGSLGGRACEMAVLVVAAHWDSAFERTAHEAVGRAAGLTGAELAAIAADAPLDRETVFELTTFVGYYATLAPQMRVFRV